MTKIVRLFFLLGIISAVAFYLPLSAPVISHSPVADEPLIDGDTLFDNEFYLRGDSDGEYLFLLKTSAAKNQLAETADFYLRNYSRQVLSTPEIGRSQLAARVNDKVLLAAKVAMSSDERAAAEDLYRAAGLISEWRIAGPFGRFEQASFFEHFAAENFQRGEDLAAVMPVQYKKLTWRNLTAPLPFVPWWYCEENSGALYLITQFTGAEKQTAEFTIDTDSFAQVWLDEQKILPNENEILLLPAGRKIKFTAQLNAGAHRLLLKLLPGNRADNQLTVLVRPEKKDSLTFDFSTPSNGIAGVKILTTDFLPRLDLAALPNYSVPQLENYAGRFMEARFFEDAAAVWEELTKRLPNNSAAWARYADTLRSASLLPLAKREAMARYGYETALKLNPQNVPALLALAEYEAAKKREASAQKFLHRALAANPRSLLALNAAAGMLLSVNWLDDAEKAIDALQKIYPRCFAAVLLTGQLAEKRGDFSTCYAAVKTAIKSNADHLPFYEQLLRAALLANQTADALAEFNKDSVLRNLPIVANWRTQLLLAIGQYAEAEKAVIRQPAEFALTWTQLGVINAMQNKNTAAADAWGKSLKINPSQHSIRRWRADLTGEKYQFWQATDIEAATAIKNFQSQNLHDGRTARLIDQTVLEIYPDNSFVNYTHGLQAVLTESGVASAAQVAFMGEPILAETILPAQGFSLEPTRLESAEQFTMPNVAPGVFIHNKFLQSESARTNLGLFFPQWYFRSPDTEEQFIFSQYILRFMPGTEIAYATKNFTADIETTETSLADGGKTVTFTAKNMPRSVHEMGGLVIDETLPFVRIGPKNSWNDLNLLYANYYLGRIAPTPSLQTAVAKILAGNSDNGKLTRRQKIDKIFSVVCQEVEQTGWLAPAAQIWEQRSGERNLVLLAMLRIADLEPRLVAVRPAEKILFAPVWDLPDIDIFTNFMVMVRDDNRQPVWLDARSRFSLPNELVEDFSGGTALIIDPQTAGELTTLPQTDENKFGWQESRDYFIAPNFQLSGMRKIYGAAAIALKEKMAVLNEIEKRNTIEQLFTDELPTFALKNFSLSGVGAELTVIYEGDLIDAIYRQLDGKQGAAINLPPLYLLPPEDFANRRSDYHLQSYIARDERYRFILPKNATPEKLPANLLIKNDFGFYQLSFQQRAGEIQVARKCFFGPQRISLAKWSGFEQMAQQITDAENQILWWKESELTQ